ncbi:MAG: 5-formyltetrahydrofolate cyclo-ligase [Bdellovibrionales bacterium]
MSLQSQKASLRREFRERRIRYQARQGGRAAAAARTSLTFNLRRWLRDYDNPQTLVCAYQPLAEEASFDLDGISCFYPRLRGEQLDFYRPLARDAFHLNHLGIAEPLPERSVALSKEIVAGRSLVVVLCPAVAVDTMGHRLGMGKGYYDRFFADHPVAVRVGVVYQIQVCDHPLPAESWDQVLDWIVTDKMILRTSTSKRSS